MYILIYFRFILVLFRYSSCNTQECPAGTKDFRLEQCQKFNSIPFERKLYDWIPYLKAPRKCELNCMPRGERFYYRHEKMVISNSFDRQSVKMKYWSILRLQASSKFGFCTKYVSVRYEQHTT